MPDASKCKLCRWCRTATFGVVCMCPDECKYKHGATFWTNKPAGYRTPEDRLADIERRLERLEGRDATR